jgi:ATP-dependent Clp protease ATP-binding subunit ClpB
LFSNAILRYEALKKETDPKSKARLKEIEKLIADLKEETSEIELKWNNEKETVADIKAIKKQLEELRREADTAEAKADLSKAAEIRYGRIPALEKDLDGKTKISQTFLFYHLNLEMAQFLF